MRDDDWLETFCGMTVADADVLDDLPDRIVVIVNPWLLTSGWRIFMWLLWKLNCAISQVKYSFNEIVLKSYHQVIRNAFHVDKHFEVKSNGKNGNSLCVMQIFWFEIAMVTFVFWWNSTLIPFMPSPTVFCFIELSTLSTFVQTWLSFIVHSCRRESIGQYLLIPRTLLLLHKLQHHETRKLFWNERKRDTLIMGNHTTTILSH